MLRVTRATAPLWIEYPANVVAGSKSRTVQRLAEGAAARRAHERLRVLAGEAPTVAEPASGDPSAAQPIA